MCVCVCAVCVGSLRWRVGRLLSFWSVGRLMERDGWMNQQPVGTELEGGRKMGRLSSPLVVEYLLLQWNNTLE